MKRLKFILLALVFGVGIFSGNYFGEVVFAADTSKNYYTVYEDNTKTKVLFLKGEDVSNGDKYLSGDNKLYEIESVDDTNKTAIAKFLKDEKLPTYNVKSKSESNSASAASNKKVGVYHTHNDESYFKINYF